MTLYRNILFAVVTSISLSGCGASPTVIVAEKTNIQTVAKVGPKIPSAQEDVSKILEKVADLVERERYEEADAAVKSAAAELKRLCQKDNAYACYELSEVREHGTIGLNVERCSVLIKACSLKHVEACKTLKYALSNGYCGPEDQEARKAAAAQISDQLEAQCLEADWRACNSIYGDYRWRTDLPTDKAQQILARFLENAEHACEQNDIEACEKVALHWDRDKDDASENLLSMKFYKKAISLYETACDSGDMSACIKLGDIWSDTDDKNRGGQERDRNRGAGYFFRACQSGVMDGCVKAAEVWTSYVELKVEEGVPQLPVDGWVDPERPIKEGTYIIMIPPSIKNFMKGRVARDIACAEGVSDECWKLAMELGNPHNPWYDRETSEQTFKRTRKLLEKRCEAGRGGCLVLSFLYRDGDGAPLDGRRYKRYVEMNCEQGNRLACINAARLNALDFRAPSDLVKTRNYYREVCGEYIKYGCVPLGYMYEHGIGGEKDLEKAREFYTLVCGDLWTEGCGPLERIDAHSRSNPGADGKQKKQVSEAQDGPRT